MLEFAAPPGRSSVWDSDLIKALSFFCPYCRGNTVEYYFGRTVYTNTIKLRICRASVLDPFGGYSCVFLVQFASDLSISCTRLWNRISALRVHLQISDNATQ